MIHLFQHEQSQIFQSSRPILATVIACFQSPPLGLIANALELPEETVVKVVTDCLYSLMYIEESVVSIRDEKKGLIQFLSHSFHCEFFIDAADGHNKLCALYLKFCGNKSVAVEHTWQEYLRTYGCTHLRKTSRKLRRFTDNIRKIDETANIRGTIPRQLGYVVGLQEIYARRVGLFGRIPDELGELKCLRVLSMGNNKLCGELPQRYKILYMYMYLIAIIIVLTDSDQFGQPDEPSAHRVASKSTHWSSTRM
jgi:hypothetical protein